MATKRNPGNSITISEITFNRSNRSGKKHDRVISIENFSFTCNYIFNLIQKSAVLVQKSAKKLGSLYVYGGDMCKHKQDRDERRVKEKEVTLLKIFTRQSSREKFTMISLVDGLVS